MPADDFGLHQIIRIGPMSGKSNVIFWLEARAYDADPVLVDTIFEAAKNARRNMTDDEIESIVKQHVS